jgi:hypothetical protein
MMHRRTFLSRLAAAACAAVATTIIEVTSFGRLTISEPLPAPPEGLALLQRIYDECSHGPAPSYMIFTDRVAREHFGENWMDYFHDQPAQGGGSA